MTFKLNKNISDKVNELIYQCMNEVLTDSSIQLSMDTKLEDLELDSLNYIDLIVQLEDIFKIEFEDSYLHTDAFMTIGNIVEYVQNKI